MATAWVERRLAALLAADVVGYSRLVEQDEAATLSALKDLRRGVIEPLLAAHHGRIVKTMGDGVIAEFGSVVDAVACAVALQKGVASRQAAVAAERRIIFRIGINLGDVVVEGDDLLGDGVNIAARLEQICEPGGILVSGTAYDQLQGKLTVTLDFAGEQRVKNIDRPIRTYRARLNGAAARRHSMVWTRPRKRLSAAGALLALAVAAFGIWRFWPVGEPLRRAGIAVLPFENLSGDESTGRVADGLTEDIITDLSHFPDLDVIARNTTAAFKAKPVDIRQVGKALNVGYVLEGSLRRQDDRVRLTAQLVDAATGVHVWSNRWDRPTADMFALQSGVAEQVAAKLGGAFGIGAITAAEIQRARRRPPASLTAYEHYLLAAEAKSLRRPEMGLDHAEKAVELDPNFARAYTARGWLRFFMIAGDDDWKRTIERVGDDFRRAVFLDPADAEARMALGVYLTETGRSSQAAVEFNRAIEQSPANAHVLAVVAGSLPYLGRSGEAVMLADRALRLDPYMPPATRGALKDVYFFARRFERAVEIIEAIPESSRSRWARVVLAASYAMLGRSEEAAAAKAALVAKQGETSAEHWLNEGPPFAGNAEQNLFAEAFQKLGMPVCYKPEELAKRASPRRLPECVKT